MATEGPIELVAGSGPKDVALPFRAYGVFIQNFTAQYVYIADVGFIPPNTSGGMPLNGTNKSQARFLAPPSVIQPIAVPGQTCSLTYLDYPVPPTAGPTQGSAIAAVTQLENFAKGAIPAAGNPGRLILLTDYDRALWKDTGANWASVEGEVFDVKQFQARGDNIADDTAAIQAAINATPNSGAIVRMPPGNYRISATLTIGNGTAAAISTKSNVSLIGAGRGRTAAEAGTDAATTITWAGAVGGTMISVLGPIAAIRIEGMMLDAATIAATGLSITHAFSSAFVHLKVRRWTGLAYTITAYPAPAGCAVGANQNRWEDCMCIEPSGAAYGGIQIGAADTGAVPHLDVAQNTFIGCVWLGSAMLAGQAAIELRYCDSLSFYECGVQGVGGGLFVSSCPSNRGFPGAVTFYQTALGSAVHDGLWAPPAGTGSRIAFLPWGEGGSNPPPVAPFWGISDTGTFFGDVFTETVLFNLNSSQTPAASTFYFGPGVANEVATEPPRQISMPRACRIRNLRVRTTTAQPGGGTGVITLRRNAGATAVQIVIPAGAAAGEFTDVTNAATFAAGDLLAFSSQNNDGGIAGAAKNGISFELNPT